MYGETCTCLRGFSHDSRPISSPSLHPLRFALPGFGRLAEEVHAPVIGRLPEAELVAIADPDPERRKRAGSRLPEDKIFASQQEMLDAVEAEAVLIAAPPAAHKELACAALESGRHVYLEKPAAPGLSEAPRRPGLLGTSGVGGCG